MVTGGITDVDGLLVGHDTDLANGKGCTVVLCPPEGAVAGVDVRGPAPGTRETDLARPGHLVERVNAVLLAGGSAFGLAAADGVMRFLEEKGLGFQVGAFRVPIVPSAVIFDLPLGSAQVRPNADAGYRACAAAIAGPIAEGTVGAGTGATVGHVLGWKSSTKGGLGTASAHVGKGIIVGALMVVNAFGDVVDPRDGQILAGARKPAGGGWLDTASAVKTDLGQAEPNVGHTTIGVVATNAALTKEQANLVAMMAHDGIARAVRPAHTLYDGDTIFALSAGKERGDVSVIGQAAAEVVAEAIVRAVNEATGLHGIPARRELAQEIRN